MFSMSIMELFIFLLIIYVVDFKFKKIEKQNLRTNKMLDVLLKHLAIQYPSCSQLSDKVIAHQSEGNLVKACNLVMEEFGCSYEDAHIAISKWHEDMKSK